MEIDGDRKREIKRLPIETLLNVLAVAAKSPSDDISEKDRKKY